MLSSAMSMSREAASLMMASTCFNIAAGLL